MPQSSHHEKILHAGLGVFHELGFHGSGVQDVVTRAGVPKGSFYNHFQSKNALGVAVLERYWGLGAQARAFLEDETMKPLDRLDRHFAAFGFRVEGCLLGNFSAELSQNDRIQEQLSIMWRTWVEALATCLEAGQRDGSVRSDLSARDLARSVLALWEGAVLMGRVERDAEPLDAARRTMRCLLAA